MKESKPLDNEKPENNAVKMVLDEIVQEGAITLLRTALSMEVDSYMDRHGSARDAAGHSLVVRNGLGQERRVLTGVGELRVRAPRVNDKRQDHRFTSSLLPPYLRKTKNMEELLPALYLKGISTGAFGEVLSSLVGKEALGLSASTISRLKQVWEAEYNEWRQRDLSEKEYVYWWVDGIYSKVRMDQEKQCLLVIMGATKEGVKELVAVDDGYRESTESWLSILRALKSHGFSGAPSIAVGDGALGFWSALEKEFPGTKQQRCWRHKTVNVLDKMSKGVQSQAKQHLHDISLADDLKSARSSFKLFCETYEAKYSKAVECLAKDIDTLLTFFDFPAEHWKHLRTTNPLESTFATIRLRTKRTRNCGSRTTTLAMTFKLAQSAEKRWQKLNKVEYLSKIVEGYIFKDGIFTGELAA